MSLPFIILLVLFALQIKHFVVDFPLQVKYQYENKGTYMHPGGLLHSMLHGVGTFAVFVFCISPALAAGLALLDLLIHYHIDWAKVNINRKFGWGPTTHTEFWSLLGFDQLLHQLTYLALVYLAFVYQ